MRSEIVGKDFIEHYGVKGMKWGVRRSQAQLDKASGRKSSKEAEAKVKSSRKEASKNRRTISDKDLDNLINRLNKEKKLKELVDADTSPGQKFVKNLLSVATNRAVQVGAGGLASYGVYKLAGRFGPEEVQRSLQSFFKPKK